MRGLIDSYLQSGYAVIPIAEEPQIWGLFGQFCEVPDCNPLVKAIVFGLLALAAHSYQFDQQFGKFYRELGELCYENANKALACAGNDALFEYLFASTLLVRSPLKICLTFFLVLVLQA